MAPQKQQVIDPSIWCEQQIWQGFTFKLVLTYVIINDTEETVEPECLLLVLHRRHNH